MVGSGDGDGVHVFLLENLAEIFLDGRGFAGLALHSVGEFLKDIAVDVADMRDAGGGFVRLESREMRVAAAVETDYSKVQAVVGTDYAAVALGRGFQRKPRRSYCKCI